MPNLKRNCEHACQGRTFVVVFVVDAVDLSRNKVVICNGSKRLLVFDTCCSFLKLRFAYMNLCKRYVNRMKRSNDEHQNIVNIHGVLINIDSLAVD